MEIIKSINCINCFTEILFNDSISCMNKHKICSESIGEFTNNLCKIVCKYCETKTIFTDKKVIANISDELCEQLFKIREDIASKRTEIDCKKRYENNLHNSIINKHRNFICENILTLHCPNKKCNIAIFDFTGCFAIECASCKSSICGWCLGDYSPNAHSHVKNCTFSLNQGSVYGTFEQFNQVHIKKRTANVKKYLELIYDKDECKEVKKKLYKDLLDLNIKLDLTTLPNISSTAINQDLTTLPNISSTAINQDLTTITINQDFQIDPIFFKINTPFKIFIT